eukprot:479661-Rhodomonas_salina.1
MDVLQGVGLVFLVEGRPHHPPCHSRAVRAREGDVLWRAHVPRLRPHQAPVPCVHTGPVSRDQAVFLGFFCRRREREGERE